jgi:hypothetical protein
MEENLLMLFQQVYAIIGIQGISALNICAAHTSSVKFQKKENHDSQKMQAYGTDFV